MGLQNFKIGHSNIDLQVFQANKKQKCVVQTVFLRFSCRLNVLKQSFSGIDNLHGC